MNRIVLVGLTAFFGLVAVALIGRPATARAGHGMHLYGCFCSGGQRCYGSAWHGCRGPAVCSGCYGCSGCSGCSGAAVASCHGHLGCWSRSSCSSCSCSRSCSGCYSCSGCAGWQGYYVPVEVVPVEAPPAPPAVQPAPAPASTEWRGSAGGWEAELAADIRVHLPADARLTVGQFDTQSAGPVRTFRSPTLEAGKTYVYEMHAEWSDRGRTVTQTKRVQLTAGQALDVDFDDEPPQVANR